MIEKIHINDLIQNIDKIPIIDVRSPIEFDKAHIPGAFNIPLFSDEERKRVGIRYKEAGKDSAVLLGLDFVGPKMKQFIKSALKIAPEKGIIIHCWRGGMRSKSMAWLFDFYGFKVSVLVGGYKSFRNTVLKSFKNEANIVILGGKTGSGKTFILKEIAKLNEQVLDLEAIANHKGSAFGSIGEIEQVSNEHFENKLFIEWNKLDLNKRIWFEDESHNIGRNFIPIPLFNQMRKAKTIFIDVDKNARIDFLVDEYSKFGNELIEKSLQSIGKRIGNNNLKTALEALQINDYKTITYISLQYYDKAYMYGLSKRNQETILKIEIEKLDFEKIAKQIIQISSK